jgi:hypothetical protein
MAHYETVEHFSDELQNDDEYQKILKEGLNARKFFEVLMYRRRHFGLDWLLEIHCGVLTGSSHTQRHRKPSLLLIASHIDMSQQSVSPEFCRVSL